MVVSPPKPAVAVFLAQDREADLGPHPRSLHHHARSSDDKRFNPTALHHKSPMLTIATSAVCTSCPLYFVPNRVCSVTNPFNVYYVPGQKPDQADIQHLKLLQGYLTPKSIQTSNLWSGPIVHPAMARLQAERGPMLLAHSRIGFQHRASTYRCGGRHLRAWAWEP